MLIPYKENKPDLRKCLFCTRPDGSPKYFRSTWEGDRKCPRCRSKEASRIYMEMHNQKNSNRKRSRSKRNGFLVLMRKATT